MTSIAYNPVTKAVDVTERSSERWNAFLETYPRFGESLAKNGLENVDLLQPLFQGKSAQGVGSFSPAMGKGKASLSKSIEDLTLTDPNEGSGVSGDVVPNDDDDDDLPNISYVESISPVKVVPAVASGSGSKRKSDTSLESYDSKRRQESFEDVIQMLAKAATPENLPTPTKAELIRDALTKMQIESLCGKEHFLKFYTFLLSEPRHTVGFLALDDTYKWMYLQNMFPADPK